MRGNTRVDDITHRILVTNWIKRRGMLQQALRNGQMANGERLKEEEKKNPLSHTSIFENTAKCLACGKEKFVNTSGFCEKCWITFSHLRKRSDP